MIMKQEEQTAKTNNTFKENISILVIDLKSFW